MVQVSNPGGSKIFCTHPDWPWGLHLEQALYVCVCVHVHTCMFVCVKFTNVTVCCIKFKGFAGCTPLV
jgi:hypothetical protein